MSEPIDQSTDQSIPEIDERMVDFLRPSPTIADIKLRPLTSGSFAILHRTRNAFVVPGKGEPDHFSAALEYAFIHGAPLDHVLRAAHTSPDRFRTEVFKFAEKIGLNDVPAIIHEIEVSLNAAAKQSVDVVPRPESGDKDAPPNS
jgi:hypothetical protein